MTQPFLGTRNTRPLTPEERAERIARADAHVRDHLPETIRFLANQAKMMDRAVTPKNRLSGISKEEFRAKMEAAMERSR